MRVIGITGGIGSGKSELCKILENRGYQIIYADNVGHDIMKKGHRVYDEVISAFGEDILDSQGEIDRSVLGGIVFSNSDKLELLNSITRSGISKEIDERLKSIKDSLAVFIEVPLPIKEGFLDRCDQIWCVSASEDKRIERIMKYRGLSKEAACKRIAAQPPRDAYIDIADVIIENEGTVKDLEDKLDMVLF